MFSTVPGQKYTRFSDVYLKRFKRRFPQKIYRENVVQNIFFYLMSQYTNAKLKRLSLKLFQIYTVQLGKLSTFLTCISVLKPVNPSSCFGRTRAINDFGKLFSARSYKVTLEIKIFRFTPKINFNCCGFSILFH